MIYKAMNIAKYIINKCNNYLEPINNLQLQKILYYIQKAFLVEFGSPAFNDRIEAWQFGPVIPVVYNRYCGFGSEPILTKYTYMVINQSDIQFMDHIIKDKYNKYPWDLVNDINAPHKAWSLIYKNGLGNHHEIPQYLIRIDG